MYSQCLACERGIQIPRDHMFPFAHSCTSLASIIRKSDLFYTCCGSADNIHDYPSHVSCFSERRGQYVWVHMCTCSSMCVERQEGREGRAVWDRRETSSLSLVFISGLHSLFLRQDTNAFFLPCHSPKRSS